MKYDVTREPSAVTQINVGAKIKTEIWKANLETRCCACALTLTFCISRRLATADLSRIFQIAIGFGFESQFKFEFFEVEGVAAFA